MSKKEKNIKRPTMVVRIAGLSNLNKGLKTLQEAMLWKAREEGRA